MGTARRLTVENTGILYPAVETIDIVCRPPMKFLQAAWASTEVKNAARMFYAHGGTLVSLPDIPGRPQATQSPEDSALARE